MDVKIIFAIILFVITYVVMFTLQGIRPHAAIVSACIFVAAGSLGLVPGFSYTIPEAVGKIDWNVIMMISGTMGLVFFFIESKMPNLMSDLIVSKVHTVKWLVLSMSLFAGLISAFVDNVATVLMIAPVALAVCKKLKISPVPAIICISISSNLQGAATLVGDTTSILLSKAAELDFMDFFFVKGRPGMFWVTEAGAAVSLLIILWMFRKENADFDIHDLTKVDDRIPAILLCMAVLTLILASFIPYKDSAAPGQFYKPDVTNGLICMFYFLVAIVHQRRADGNMDRVKQAVKEIDYYTIALLIGLFVVIGGIEKAGLIDLIGVKLASLSGSGTRMSIFVIYSIIVWMSVLFSAFIDNIPYTATMLPVVAVISKQLSQAGGIDIDPNLFYFGLLAGATLGGNLTPIGASANIAGIGILRKEGHTVPAGTFMKYSVPFTFGAVLSAYLLIWTIWM